MTLGGDFPRQGDFPFAPWLLLLAGRSVLSTAPPRGRSKLQFWI